MIELDSSLIKAEEEALFFLHHIWIYKLGSEYHPRVMAWALDPGKIEVELERWMPLPPRDWLEDPANMSDDERAEQREAIHQMARHEQEAVSDLRSRKVKYTILARKTDDLKTQKAYQLSFAIYLVATAPAMEWQARQTGEITLSDLDTGEREVLPPRFCVGDCMNTRYHVRGVKGSNFDRAVAFYAA